LSQDFRGKGSSPCQYIDTTRKAIDCATMHRGQFLYNETLYRRFVLYCRSSKRRQTKVIYPTTRVLCSNAAKTRNPLKFAVVPKLANRSEPLVGRSSPYCKDMWGRYCCFLPIVDTCLRCKDTARQSCAMVRRWRFFASYISSEPHAAHFIHAFEIITKATSCVEVW